VRDDQSDPHEVEEGPDGGQRLRDWWEVILPLLTFAVDKQDTTSLVMILALALTLRAIAG